MSKKQRRTRAQGTQTAQRAEGVQVKAGVTPQPVRIARPPRAPSEPRAKEVDFRQEYQYVLQDLKKIAIFAAGLFTLLIVLALLFSFAG